MTRNSYICRFIAEHPDTWREEMDNRGIRVKQSDNLTIFNYVENCDFSDPIVQEARGIIIYLYSLDVVCWPFRKFGNYTAGYSDKIDWSSARVQEKYDGSFVKLFYNRIRQRWQWSTMSCIKAEDAMLFGDRKNYQQLIEQADNYSPIAQMARDGLLNKDYTFMFELVSPEIDLVVKYPTTHLWHIGTRSSYTGEELDWTLEYFDEDAQEVRQISKPKEYALHSLEDCINAAASINKSKECLHEGFVVVDKNWNRVKVKSPEYMVIHWVENNGILTKETAIRILRDNGGQCDQYCLQFPKMAPAMRYYAYKYEEIQYQADRTVKYARGLLEENDGDRKAIVSEVKKLPLSVIGFRGLTNNKSGREILNECWDSQIIKHIPDYQMPSLEGGL